MAAPPLTFPQVSDLYTNDTPSYNTQAGQIVEARCHVIVPPPGWWKGNNYNGSMLWGAYIRSLNPNICALMYYHSIAEDPGEWYSFATAGWHLRIGSTQYYRPAEWRLCYAGTTMTLTSSLATAAAMTAGQTVTITSNSLTVPFAANTYAVICDVGGANAEVVYVTGVSGTTLTLTRQVDSQGSGGTWASPTSPHFSGPAHASGSVIKPCVWTEGGINFLGYNISSNCPTSTAYTSAATWPDGSAITALTYNQFMAKFLTQALAHEPAYASPSAIDGYFLDNVDDRLSFQWSSPTAIATAQNNTADGLTQAQFNTALGDLCSQIRTAIGPSAIVMGNTGGHVGTSGSGQPANTGSYGGSLNGGMIEGVRHGVSPTSEYAAPHTTGGTSHEYYDSGTFSTDLAQTKGFVADWLAGGHAPRVFIYNGSPVDQTVAATDTDYKALRFLLGEACMLGATLCFDGYNSTDSAGNHAHLPWFDEYAITVSTGAPASGNANGWLGIAVGAAYASGGCQFREFANGLVVVNEDQSNSATPALPFVCKAISGTQDATANNGATNLTSITVPAQDARFLIKTGTLRQTASTRHVATTRVAIPSPRPTAGRRFRV